nr:hypothetical protein CFP56_34408 [Quercus suber]
MAKARVDAMAEFRISQPFFDACGVYYGYGFEDCLKQEVKDTEGMVIVQPAPDGPDAIMVSFVENPIAAKGLPAVNPATPNAPPS